MRLSETSAGQAVIIMAYGGPGVGKSEFLASTDTSRAVCFSDLNGIRTLRNNRVRRLYPNFDPEIEIVQPDKSVQTAKAFNFIKSRIDYWLEKKPDEFDWLLFDDMSSLRRNAMYEAVKINGQTGENPKSNTASRSIAMNGALLPTEADYGTEMDLVLSFIKDITAACRFYNKNLLMLAHENTIFTKDKKTRVETPTMTAPAFTGKKSPANVANEFDFVFRMTSVGKGNRVVQFQCHPDDVVVAKDRDSVFKVIESGLTMKKVLETIRLGVSPNTVNVPPVAVSSNPKP